MPDVEIYSANVCPFAQRTRMVLLEKGVEYSLTEVDLREKPQWFLDMSPYGKVPLVRHNGRTLYESAIINEYLDEVYPQVQLLPEDAGAKALARIWIDYCNTQFIPAYYRLLLTQDPEKQAKLKAKVEEQFRFVEREGLEKLQGDGPYWMGADLTLVDLTWYPFVERFAVAEHYRDIEIPAECTRFKAWFATMGERESVKATSNPPEFYIKAYARYADGTVGGRTADEFRGN